MQALTRWTPPGGVLGTLVAEAEERARQLDDGTAELERRVAVAQVRPSFAGSLRRPDVALIAELKRRSPSKGDLAPGLVVSERARQYVEAGAAALSVLTQSSHFGGRPADLEEAAASVAVPLLRKDFIVSPLQLLEARALGASAALLIARALPPDRLTALAAAARDAGLETLIEIRDEAELEAALAAGADVIGVNNRNLETLAIDARVGERLIPLLPADRPAVYESGVGGRADVERAAACGADAVLVGSVLSSQADGAGAAAALTGVPRRGRGGER